MARLTQEDSFLLKILHQTGTVKLDLLSEARTLYAYTPPLPLCTEIGAGKRRAKPAAQTPPPIPCQLSRYPLAHATRRARYNASSKGNLATGIVDVR
jgi:hypothetical protein